MHKDTHCPMPFVTLAVNPNNAAEDECKWGNKNAVQLVLMMQTIKTFKLCVLIC